MGTLGPATLATSARSLGGPPYRPGPRKYHRPPRKKIMRANGGPQIGMPGARPLSVFFSDEE